MTAMTSIKKYSDADWSTFNRKERKLAKPYVTHKQREMVINFLLIFGTAVDGLWWDGLEDLKLLTFVHQFCSSFSNE